MIRTQLLVVLLIIASSLVAAGQASNVISFTGFGPVEVGMSQSEAARAIGDELVEEPSGTEGCFQVHPKSQPKLHFMIEDDHITRVETDDARYQTFNGIRVGDSEEKVKELCKGSAEISVHHYDPTGHYLTIRSKDKKQAIVIETDGNTVIYIRAGVVPSAEFVEGCL